MRDRSYPETPSDPEAASPGLSIVQKLIGTVIILVILSLVLVMFLAHAQNETHELIPAALRLSRSELHLDPKTGKTVWTGTVTNGSTVRANAPWVKVTLYDPAGDSIDTADAMSGASTIAGSGILDYTTTFDTRGSQDLMRVKTELELPNSRPLGM